MSHDGYIKLYRKFLTNELWMQSRKYSQAEAWLDLLMSVNWIDSDMMIGYTKISVPAGSLMTSQHKLAQRWKWNIATVHKFLNGMSERHYIDVIPNSKYTIISICKWELYQVMDKDTRRAAKRPVPPIIQDGQADIPIVASVAPVVPPKAMAAGDKVQYGQLVFMMPEEHQTLLDRYGLSLTNDMIAKLDAFIPNMVRKPYKDHYAAINSWVAGAVLKERGHMPTYDLREKHKTEQQRIKEQMQEQTSLKKNKVSRDALRIIKEMSQTERDAYLRMDEAAQDSYISRKIKEERLYAKDNT